ncbi:hypothetical protein Pcinc_000489 [Petrolisthes cinctipes]|uniref:Integrase zinc-binding domain-containing protein n=2 Tax=Petrolisthes cinctipes TaxID=88211 RepID=A0AAE1GQ06_PETCI|nr:hypothetical protein Pcinc_000489 [Petrolisthes cinctipes]
MALTSNNSVEEYILACRKRFAEDDVLHERVIFYQQTKHVDGITNAERKRIWRRSSSFEWNEADKTLYFIQAAASRRKVLRNFNDLPIIFNLYHSSPVGGHSGWNATYEKISKVYYWRNMTQDIQHYVCGYTHISTCSQCQKYTPLKIQAPEMRPIKVKEPLELLGVDLIGGANLGGYCQTRDVSFVHRLMMNFARPTASRGVSHQRIIRRRTDWRKGPTGH